MDTNRRDAPRRFQARPTPERQRLNRRPRSLHRHPVPHERLLTRAVGVGNRWMSVSTLAAAGSALNWVQKTLFADLTAPAYFKLIDKLATKPIPDLRAL